MPMGTISGFTSYVISFNLSEMLVEFKLADMTRPARGGPIQRWDGLRRGDNTPAPAQNGAPVEPVARQQPTTAAGKEADIDFLLNFSPTCRTLTPFPCGGGPQSEQGQKHRPNRCQTHAFSGTMPGSPPQWVGRV